MPRLETSNLEQATAVDAKKGANIDSSSYWAERSAVVDAQIMPTSKADLNKLGLPDVEIAQPVEKVATKEMPKPDAIYAEARPVSEVEKPKPVADDRFSQPAFGDDRAARAILKPETVTAEKPAVRVFGEPATVSAAERIAPPIPKTDVADGRVSRFVEKPEGLVAPPVESRAERMNVWHAMEDYRIADAAPTDHNVAPRFDDSGNAPRRYERGYEEPGSPYADEPPTSPYYGKPAVEPRFDKATPSPTQLPGVFRPRADFGSDSSSSWEESLNKPYLEHLTPLIRYDRRTNSRMLPATEHILNRDVIAMPVDNRFSNLIGSGLPEENPDIVARNTDRMLKEFGASSTDSYHQGTHLQARQAVGRDGATVTPPVYGMIVQRDAGHEFPHQETPWARKAREAAEDADVLRKHFAAADVDMDDRISPDELQKYVRSLEDKLQSATGSAWEELAFDSMVLNDISYNNFDELQNSSNDWMNESGISRKDLKVREDDLALKSKNASSADDINNFVQKNFHQIDTDGDGKVGLLEVEEFKQALEQESVKSYMGWTFVEDDIRGADGTIQNFGKIHDQLTPITRQDALNYLLKAENDAA